MEGIGAHIRKNVEIIIPCIIHSRYNQSSDKKKN